MTKVSYEDLNKAPFPSNEEVLRVMEGNDLEGDGLIFRAQNAYRQFGFHANNKTPPAAPAAGAIDNFDFWLVRQCMIEARCGFKHMIGDLLADESEETVS